MKEFIEFTERQLQWADDRAREIVASTGVAIGDIEKVAQEVLQWVMEAPASAEALLGKFPARTPETDRALIPNGPDAAPTVA